MDYDQLAIDVGHHIRERIKKTGGRAEFVLRTGVNDGVLSRFLRGENVSSKTVFAILDGVGLGYVLSILSGERSNEISEDPAEIAINAVIELGKLQCNPEQIRKILEKQLEKIDKS